MNIRSKIFGSESGEAKPLMPAKQPKGVRADELHSIPVEREETRSTDTRLEDRHRLSGEKVRLTHAGRSYDVGLVNLSGGGAMVSGDLQPMLWDKVELQLGENGNVECAVLWLREGRIGLEFAHETRLACTADEQAAVLREVITRSFPDLEFDNRTAESHSGGPREQRQGEARHPLIWSGVLNHDYQTTMVRIRNISSTGAMVESSSPVRVGAQPVLELSDAASLGCEVVWAVGDQVGLRFHKPFDMSLLATARPEVAQGLSDQWDHATLNELHDELKGFMKH